MTGGAVWLGVHAPPATSPVNCAHPTTRGGCGMATSRPTSRFSLQYRSMNHPHRRGRVAVLRGAGWTVADLADRYRCTCRTINRRIAAAGAATPARPSPRPNSPASGRS